MPLLAARLADVGVRHPRPPVTLGREQHLLDPPAVLLLDARTVRVITAYLRDAAHELVAQLRELAEREQRGSGPGTRRGRRRCARPAGGEQPRQLGLQALDLGTERTSRGAFVRLCSRGLHGGVHLITEISGWVASSVWVKT